MPKETLDKIEQLRLQEAVGLLEKKICSRISLREYEQGALNSLLKRFYPNGSPKEGKALNQLRRKKRKLQEQS